MASLREPFDKWKKVRQQYCYNQDWMKDGGLVVVECFCSLTRPRPPGRQENSIWKTIWRTIQRSKNSFWTNGWTSSDLTRGSSKNSSIWQESITRNLSWLWVSPRVNLERIYSDIRSGRFGKVGCIRCVSSKNQCERRIDQTKRWWIHIPFWDGTAKLSGRNYEFREPTLRRQQTVRSEDFSGELQGEAGESHSTGSEDDAEARADCWWVQGDLIYRHHN